MLSNLLHINTLWVMASTMILGIAAGGIGCLAYWKRQNLMSDALSHAALPGVVVAFLIIQEKNLLLLVIGAALSALLGAFFIQWFTSASRITEDTAMGMTLSVFYGLGVMLLAIANRSPGGNQSGLNNFIYGQAAAMVRSDVITMVVLAAIVIFIIFIAFKEWKLFLFDPDFAKGIGLSIRGMNVLYTIVLVTTIVIGIQAVGVILMAAMLIIPAVSARYWTHSFKMMILLSSVIGGLSGAFGTWVSSTGSGLPTGPFIVLTSAAVFTISLFFGKEHGIVIRYIQFKMQQRSSRLDHQQVMTGKGGRSQ
ncbi:metal ABC transporter permease [Oceanobacillus sojae]|uniref:metal ABC transporter permease n=1 Tax=Oceanobacillus sojae TaxID=582851 RepID=UPI0021A2B38C|nr:metal ABC transporter permease [Oceanobacillus sojae]MCT1901739.1 metal ABC transporter permease [Oceanobacillus sojae]